ncbi:MAG TPA: glycosyl transferase family 2 [Cyanobacteria bacterium UBA11049]|nr:glycosyl transferase family 2 [Cyanobacteria bacterium UBA11049]
MTSNPLVSSIIIFLNAEQFIQEAIESVFAQTYKQWELLLVDDGSTDGSTEIAQRYAAQYPEKVRYLEHDGHENRGMSAARNLGIGNAKGEYIALLDADDVWLPNKLEQQVAIMEAQPEVAMLYGSDTWWYSWTGNCEDSQRDRLPDLGVEVNTLFQPPTLLTLMLPRKAAVPCPSGVLVRREAIEKVGGFEERFRGMYEDQAFYAKIFLQAPVFVANGCWDKYRQHPASCYYIAKSTGKSNIARLFFLNWLEGYLLKHRISDTQVWKVLKRELFPYRYPRLHYMLEKFWYRRSRMKQLVKLLGQRTLLLQVRHWLRVQKSRQ